jgi:hypothetical protein
LLLSHLGRHSVGETVRDKRGGLRWSWSDQGAENLRGSIVKHLRGHVGIILFLHRRVG